MQKLILFGTGIEAEIFYSQYADRCSIEFVIDNYRQGMPFHGIDCYTLEESYNKIDGKKIVIATSEQTYYKISDMLSEKGYKEYEDYIWSRLFGREMAVFYGNCHIGAIVRYLHLNHDFMSRYAIRFFCLNEGRTVQHYPTEADISHSKLIVTHDIRENNKLGAPGSDWIRRKASGDCKVIVVPNLWGMNFLWPQTDEKREVFINRLKELHISPERIRAEQKRSEEERLRINSVAGGIINHKDCFIEANFSNEVSYIADRIRESDIWSKDTIRDLFSSTLEKLKEREERCDLSISDYIENNIDRQQLFYDEGHPHENIIAEKTRRILQILGIPEHDMSDMVSNDSTELFVYGCVRRAFNMQWEQKYIRRRNSQYTFQGHGISLEEYVDEYKRWVIQK